MCRVSCLYLAASSEVIARSSCKVVAASLVGGGGLRGLNWFGRIGGAVYSKVSKRLQLSPNSQGTTLS